MQIQNSHAFTLVELLVIIAVIGILALGISSINLSSISQRELLSTEVVRLVAWIEEMRNNAIVGRAYDEDGNFPESWNISFPEENDRFILSYTTLTDTEVLRTVRLREPFAFQSINCTNIVWDPQQDLTTSEKWIIFWVSWDNIIDWCTLDNWNILAIEVWFWTNSRTITVNTITWVIQEE